MVAEPRSQSGGSGPPAFEDFYVETVERTLATAQHLAGDRDIARDATQEAYVAMLERWNERKSRSPHDNQRYVVGITANKVADWYRRSGRFVPIGDSDDRPVKDDCYQQALDRMTVFKTVRSLLESQPVRRRMIGTLYFLEEFEYAEIAQALGITPSTVRTQVERLRARLKPLVSRVAILEEGGEQS
jgi:RNA polymerase sigma factor (sigma-70 family)